MSPSRPSVAYHARMRRISSITHLEIVGGNFKVPLKELALQNQTVVCSLLSFIYIIDDTIKMMLIFPRQIIMSNSSESILQVFTGISKKFRH